MVKSSIAMVTKNVPRKTAGRLLEMVGCKPVEYWNFIGKESVIVSFVHCLF